MNYEITITGKRNDKGSTALRGFINRDNPSKGEFSICLQAYSNHLGGDELEQGAIFLELKTTPASYEEAITFMESLPLVGEVKI